MSINKILTSQYQDLTQEEIANLQHTLGPVIGGGLEGYWRPTVSELGNITWTWSNASTATPPAGMNIKGPSGDKGTDGTNGKRPVIRVNSENAHWEWKYYEDTTPYIDLGVVASGEQGPQGKDGYSIDLQSISAGQGGNLITLQWGDPTDLSTSSFFLPSGVAGISPTVSITDAPTTAHPQGGKTVTITDADHPTGQSFDIWNGIDGQGATVNLVEGTGIQISHETGTTNYTIGVSADYALKSYANEASANALSEAETWVGQRNFATSAGLDDNKQYAMTTNGWSDFTIPSTSGYLPLSGGTVSGKTTISGGAFDAFELKRSGQTSTGNIGINGAGGMSLKIANANDNTQLNVAPNADMDKRFSIGNVYDPTAYLIPAKIEQAGWSPSANDKILHIVLES